MKNQQLKESITERIGTVANDYFQQERKVFMKRYFRYLILFILMFFAILLCSSCDSENKEIAKNTTSHISDTTVPETIISDTAVNGNNEPETDVGGASISTRKYRVNYYDVPYQFVLIVGEDAYWEWDEQYNNENPDETNVMVMKRFIEYFDIPKESFERANLEWAKVILNDMGSQPNMDPKDFANQETDEAYNADIIYTFNDEIINEYYLSGYYPYIFEHEYEQAVERGEYVSQTKDWIDIEEMEAEIIAKYGKAENVTEEPLTEVEEIVTTE